MQDLDRLTALPERERAWMNTRIAKGGAVCDGILEESFLLSSARGTLVREAQWLASAMTTTASRSCGATRWCGPSGNSRWFTPRSTSASVDSRDWSGAIMLTEHLGTLRRAMEGGQPSRNRPLAGRGPMKFGS